METKMKYRIAFPSPRKLLIITAIFGSVVITACSDLTAPRTLVPEGLPTAAVLAPQSGSGISAAGISIRATAGSAADARPCPAPGGGFPGALNMLHDETMFDIPMTRDAPQGNAGMFRAVAVSACDRPL